MGFTTYNKAGATIPHLVASAPGLQPIRSAVEATAPSGKTVDWNRFYYSQPGDKLPLIDVPTRAIAAPDSGGGGNAPISPPPPSAADRAASDAMSAGPSGVMLSPLGLRGAVVTSRRATLLG